MFSKGSIIETSKMVGCVFASVLTAGAVLAGCSTQSEQAQPDFTGVRAVAELSTLKAYYHNVAEANDEASGPLAGLLKTGYKRLWVEYSGTVDIGIDVGELSIDPPDDSGNVTVHMPDVKVLDVYLDRGSVADPIQEQGLFVKINAEEKMNAIAAAQEDMRKKAESDSTLNAQASDRAKQIVKRYVENVGIAIGEQYQVRWA